jgi:carboxypeptidase PM20D1
MAVLGVRTLLFSSRQDNFEPPVDAPSASDFDASGAVGRLATALTFRTISYPPPEPPARDEFRALHLWLGEAYPLVHARLELETVGELSLLYTWRGMDASLSPVVLMGHQDVVPVIPGTEDQWTHPPFDGVVADGWVWGRGAADNKATVIAVLEAVESLLAEGFQPARTIYLAFGHDEELGGEQGAGKIADLLESRRVGDFALVLDEGGAITEGMVPGIAGPAAIVGVAEKGYVSLKLVATAEGGHSSSPPESTAIGILGRAITRLEENPFPTRIDGATRSMFDYVGPEMAFGRRLLLANLWLTGPLVEKGMAASGSGAATVRTTTAATMFNAGIKDNVLPIDATAVVNFRILPGDSVESVTQRVREIVDDPRIEIGQAFSFGQEPSPISNVEGAAFRLVGRTVREVMPGEDVLVTPYLVIGGTDAKYYSGRSENVFRFLPVFMRSSDLGRIHGTDERISVESVELAVRYFRRLIRNTDEL